MLRVKVRVWVSSSGMISGRVSIRVMMRASIRVMVMVRYSVRLGLGLTSVLMLWLGDVYHYSSNSGYS
jgi:spore maturation protein SpmA